MSNQDALVELNKALQHVQKARNLAERDITAQELQSLEHMAEDCISGLETDLLYSGTEGQVRSNS